MSFGFSVGDIVLVTEKAYAVYKKCKDAPATHLELTKRVQRLRDALRDTEAYLVAAEREGTIPQSGARLTSLHATCTGCNATLDEVAEFLAKYGKVGAENGTYKFIGRLKFINADSDALTRKLDTDVSALQLRLTSLTSLSVLNIQHALARIIEGYRSGTREPTVVSRILVEDKPADEAEIFEQINRDLEEQDVHPECIALNHNYLEQWLQNVIENGGLEERPTSAHTLRRTSSKTELDRPVDDQITHIGLSLNQTDRSLPIRLPLRLLDNVLGANLIQNDSTESEKGRESKAEASNNIATTAIEALPTDVTKNSTSFPGSRTASLTEREDRHPTDDLSPTSVKAKLQSLFSDDLITDPDCESTKLMVERAFHQADDNEDGVLAERTILQHLSKALVDSESEIDTDALDRIVPSFDVNRDGQFDLQEFLTLTQYLMRRVAEIRTTRMSNAFSAIIKDGKEYFHDYEIRNGRFFVPWGFAKLPGRYSGYMDTVLHVEVKQRPVILGFTSFSVLAWEAHQCVERLTKFEEEWIRVLPISSRSEYMRPVRQVKVIASAFTLLGNQGDRLLLSDLDAALTCHRLALRTTPDKDYRRISEQLANLDAAKGESLKIVNVLIGFAASLGSENLLDATALDFGKFQVWWKSNHLAWRANVVVDASKSWSFIEDKVTTFRSGALYLSKMIEHLASDAITESAARWTELQATPWVAKVTGIALRKYSGRWISLPKAKDSGKTYVTIRFSDPQHTLETSRKDRARTIRWSRPEPVGSGMIHLTAESTIAVTVMYVDSENQGVTVKQEFAPRKLDLRRRISRGPNLNFSERTSIEGRSEVDMSLYSKSYNIELSFTFIDDKVFDEKKRELMEIIQYHDVLPLNEATKVLGATVTSSDVGQDHRVGYFHGAGDGRSAYSTSALEREKKSRGPFR